MTSSSKNRYKNILLLAIPVVVSQIGQTLVGLVDTVMVGQLGAVPLAGVSFANAIFFTFMVAGIGLAMGLTPLVSRAAVRGNFGRIQSLVKNSLALNTIVGIVFTLILGLLIYLMPYMGQDAETLDVAVPYATLMAISIVPNMWLYTLRHFLEGLGNTFWAMVAIISSNIINVGLNFLLIYGMFGLPEMGAVGAGVATFLSRILMLIFLAFIVWRKEQYRQYFRGIRQIPVLRFRILRLWRMGYPIALQMGVECGSFGAMAVAVGTFGAVTLAGHQIAVNMPTTAFMVATGIASATTILVARNYELKLYSEVRKILRSSINIVTIFMTTTAILFLIFGMEIASVFSPEHEVQVVAAHLLLYAAIFQISDGLQGVTLGALRGMLDVKRPMYISVLSYTCIGVPVATIMGFVVNMGAGGVWLGIVCTITLLSVLYLRRFNQVLKMH